MQGRYPNHIVILVEGLVGPIETEEASAWMRSRAAEVGRTTELSAFVVYQKLRSSGTMAKPRFLSVFEVTDPHRALELVSTPYEHAALRPLGIGSFELLPGLPRVDAPEADGGLMVGLTNCTNPDQDADFNAWYNRVHATDVIESPWFWNTQRYRRIEGDLPEYAALYETSLDGSEALKNYMRWPERESEMHPCIANVHVWSFDFLVSVPDRI